MWHTACKSIAISLKSPSILYAPNGRGRLALHDQYRNPLERRVRRCPSGSRFDQFAEDKGCDDQVPRMGA